MRLIVRTIACRIDSAALLSLPRFFAAALLLPFMQNILSEFPFAQSACKL
jgi:hypothetical protein